MAQYRMARVADADVDSLGLGAIDFIPGSPGGVGGGMDDYLCHNCNLAILRAFRREQAETMVVRCPKCRAWNRVTSIAKQ